MDEDDFEIDIRRLQDAETASLKRVSKAYIAGDQAACGRAELDLVLDNKRVKAALRAEGRKFDAETKLDPAADEETQVAQLLKAFARGERLARIWQDIRQESRIGSCCAMKVYKKATAVLESMNRRGDLAHFLDHPDPAVRARAASCLIQSMPERCVPILEEIYRTERILYAGSTAFLALDRHKDRVLAGET